MGQGRWVPQPRVGVLEPGTGANGSHWVRREEPQGSGAVLRRDLHFSSFGAQHLYTNFTCVVLSPLGVDTREVRWPPPAPAPAPAESRGLG